MIVVVDESALLTLDRIELLRYLHDHRTTRVALVLVGNGTWRVLSRDPMLPAASTAGRASNPHPG